MLVTISIKNQLNFRTIEISEKLFNQFKGTMVKFNNHLNRWEIEFVNEDVYYSVLKRRGL